MKEKDGFLKRLGPKYQLLAVKAMIEDGKNDQALKNCEEIHNLNPDDLDTLKILVSLCDKLDKKDKAKIYLHKIDALKKKSSQKIPLRSKKK